MVLSNQQIERYARQIIVPGVGGIAQERLMAARLMLAGKAADVSSVLAYMAGAGVGEIRLQLRASDAAEQDSLIMRATWLNPDVVVHAGAGSIAGSDLIVAIGGDSETSEPILSSPLLCAEVPLIFVRLEEPAAVGIFPVRPPCPLCADADMIGPSRTRGDNAGFVAMVATTEAFKLLAGSPPPPSPTLLQFNGFACTTRELRQRPLSARCACSVNAETR
jgi:molybdopterin/thiamine biosynthesis adenylyltransferase